MQKLTQVKGMTIEKTFAKRLVISAKGKTKAAFQ